MFHLIIVVVFGLQEAEAVLVVNLILVVVVGSPGAEAMQVVHLHNLRLRPGYQRLPQLRSRYQSSLLLG